jgi:uncharacterized protein
VGGDGKRVSGSSTSVFPLDFSHVDIGELVTRFGGLLRQAGVPVTVPSLGRFAETLSIAPPERVTELYWLARITLIHDRRYFDPFERTFNHVFRGVFDADDTSRNPNAPTSLSPSPHQNVPPPARKNKPPAADEAPRTSSGLSDTTISSSPDADDDDDQGELSASSAEERLRDRSFGTCTEEELIQLKYLLSRFRFEPPIRTSYRTRIASRGDALDLRATLRASHRTGGDPVKRVRRRPRTRPRRVVLIADVSGSMEPYARVYLYLLHSAVRAVGAEAFVFSTQLHRLTKLLAIVEPEAALRKAMAAAPDWSGGTRIGEAIKSFNDEHGRRGLGRGAVVVIVSDGWESGDPQLLGQEMDRLARLAYKIVWVNPRKQHAEYKPLVGGIVAAMPSIDDFVSGHTMNALDAVVDAIQNAAKVR